MAQCPAPNTPLYIGYTWDTIFIIVLQTEAGYYFGWRSREYANIIMK